MTDLKETVATSLAGRYRTLAGYVRQLAEPLTDEEFWRKPFAFGNSFGHLVLHLTGNLNYYIGAEIAGTGYVRDRPLEFSDSTRPSKESILKKFDQTIDMVVQTIRAQSVDDWAAAYSATAIDSKTRFEAVLACATHLHHHIGQMMYLGFELKRKS